MKIDPKIAEHARLVQALQRRCKQMPTKFSDLVKLNIYELSAMQTELKSKMTIKIIV
jgi:hypothetical protein